MYREYTCIQTDILFYCIQEDGYIVWWNWLALFHCLCQKRAYLSLYSQWNTIKVSTNSNRLLKIIFFLPLNGERLEERGRWFPCTEKLLGFDSVVTQLGFQLGQYLRFLHFLVAFVTRRNDSISPRLESLRNFLQKLFPLSHSTCDIFFQTNPSFSAPIPLSSKATWTRATKGKLAQGKLNESTSRLFRIPSTITGGL